MRKIFHFQPWLYEAIQDFRFTSRLPSEAEAVRALIEFALEAKGVKLKRPKEGRR